MDYTEKLSAAGFRQGLSSPAVFYHPSTEARLVVHEDDFTFLVYEDEVDKTIDMMKGWYDIKNAGCYRI